MNLLWEGLLLLAAAAEAYEQLGSKGGLDVLRSAEATGRRAVSQLLRSQASQADYADLLRRLEVGMAIAVLRHREGCKWNWGGGGRLLHVRCSPSKDLLRRLEVGSGGWAYCVSWKCSQPSWQV